MLGERAARLAGEPSPREHTPRWPETDRDVHNRLDGDADGSPNVSVDPETRPFLLRAMSARKRRSGWRASGLGQRGSPITRRHVEPTPKRLAERRGFAVAATRRNRADRNLRVGAQQGGGLLHTQRVQNPADRLATHREQPV